MPPLFEANGNNVTATYAWQLPTGMFMMGYTDTCFMPYVSEIIICDGITSIGEYAFAGASGLTKISIANTVTDIEDFAFFYNINLENIKLPNKIESIGKCAFSETKIQNMTIPNSVKKIGGLFYDNNNLAKIKFLATDITKIDIDIHAFESMRNGTIYVKNEIVKKYIEQNLNISNTVKIEILK